MEFRGAAEFSVCAKRGKENQSRRKENPSLRERKSKRGGRKIQAFSFRELSLFKGLRRPLTPFATPKQGSVGCFRGQRRLRHREPRSGVAIQENVGRPTFPWIPPGLTRGSR